MAFNPHNTDGFIRYSSMAFEMLAIIGLFTFIGWKLDKWLENSIPVFVLILSLSGVCLGIYLGIKDFLKVKDKKK